MADITDLVNYYFNLLIIQYHNQPKAQATIALMAETMLANGIFLDIENGFNIDTCVGKQLDIIGKYVGVDRHYPQEDFINYFSLILQSQHASPPSSPPQWGFGTQAAFGNYDYNGTLTYAGIVTTTNSLTDDDFRTLIKFQIIINTSNFSHGELDDALFKFFGDTIRMETNGEMAIVYFITPPLTPLIFAILFKQLLPHPMAVGTTIVENVTGDMFSFADYTGYESPFGYGFSQYANYGTLAGEILNYNMISEE